MPSLAEQYIPRLLDVASVAAKKSVFLFGPRQTGKTSLMRQTLSRARFFDVGVARHLQHRQGLRPRSPEFGEAFEAYVHHELKTYIDHCRNGTLGYWRSKSGFEVDFVLNNHTAIEAKAKAPVGQRDLRGLLALQEEGLLEKYVVISLEQQPRYREGIEILPWNLFLKGLWAGEYG